MSDRRLTGCLSRRGLLRQTLIAASSLATLPLLQACGGATSAPAPASAASASAPTTAPASAAPAPAPTAVVQANAAPTAAPVVAVATSAPAPTTAPAAAPTAAATVQKVTLTHWVHPLSKDDMTVWTPIIQQYQQTHGNIDVKIEQVPWTDRIQKVMSAVSANAAPDTSYVNVDEFTTYVAQNALAPLDGYLSASKVDIQDFVQGPRDAMTWKGKTYEIPILYAFRVGYYNTDAWQQAGLDPATSPTTWDEYTKTMDQLKTAKASGKVQAYPTYMAVLSSIPVGNFNPWFYQAGGHFLTADGKSGYDSEAGVTALNFMIKTFKDYCNPSNAGSQGDDMVSQFGQGTYAYLNNFELSVIKQVQHDFPQAKFAIANSMQGTVRWTHGGVGAKCIFAGSKYKDQTWDWINFITSGKPNLDYNVGFGFVPPRQSVMDDFKKTTTDKLYLRALDEAKYGGIEKAPGLWDAWAIVEPMIQAALLGKMPADAALKAAATKINTEVLQKYNG